MEKIEKKQVVRVVVYPEMNQTELDLMLYKTSLLSVEGAEGPNRDQMGWRALLVLLLALERYGYFTSEEFNSFDAFAVDVNAKVDSLIGKTAARPDLKVVYKLFVKGGGGLIGQLAPDLARFNLAQVLREAVSPATDSRGENSPCRDLMGHSALP